MTHTVWGTRQDDPSVPRELAGVIAMLLSPLKGYGDQGRSLLPGERLGLHPSAKSGEDDLRDCKAVFLNLVSEENHGASLLGCLCWAHEGEGD